MPTFRIRLTNKDFAASEELEAPTPEAARTNALRGALQIGTDEICAGKMFFGAEVCIECDGETERLLVAIGASPLT